MGAVDAVLWLAGCILKEHLPRGMHRTGAGRSEVVVRAEQREQAPFPQMP